MMTMRMVEIAAFAASDFSMMTMRMVEIAAIEAARRGEGRVRRGNRAGKTFSSVPANSKRRGWGVRDTRA